MPPAKKATDKATAAKKAAHSPVDPAHATVHTDDAAQAAFDALSDDDKAALTALSADELADLAEAIAEQHAVDVAEHTPAKKPAVKKEAAPKAEAKARPEPKHELVEPPHPAIDEAAFAAEGYHAPTIPAAVVSSDERTGFKVAEPDDRATRIAFEDGSTHNVDPETGRITDKA